MDLQNANITSESSKHLNFNLDSIEWHGGCAKTVYYYNCSTSRIASQIVKKQYLNFKVPDRTLGTNLAEQHFVHWLICVTFYCVLLVYLFIVCLLMQRGALFCSLLSLNSKLVLGTQELQSKELLNDQMHEQLISRFMLDQFVCTNQ